eukprot:6185019-Pleurochrysis_carterae.AAC.1
MESLLVLKPYYGRDQQICLRHFYELDNNALQPRRDDILRCTSLAFATKARHKQTWLALIWLSSSNLTRLARRYGHDTHATLAGCAAVRLSSAHSSRPAPARVATSAARLLLISPFWVANLGALADKQIFNLSL